MKPANLTRIIPTTVMLITIILSLSWILYTLVNSEQYDFYVFYESAQAFLNGQTIYSTFTPHDLPYWYFPWVSWFFIPLAFVSKTAADWIYTIMSILAAAYAVNLLVELYIPRLGKTERVFVLFSTFALCWLLFRVGQMDFILLLAASLIIYFIYMNKAWKAGLLIPILLFKPHLFLIFIPAAALKGKMDFIISASIITLFLLLLSFAVIPDWHLQSLSMLQHSGNRTDNNWNFTTLPNMLGYQENWSGTANLPFTLVLIIIGLASLWKFRGLPTTPFLSLALVASLFCAPRAYAYNFPLLIPTAIWLSEKWGTSNILIWLALGISPLLFRYSSGAYSIVLIMFILGLYKAFTKTVAESV